MVSKKTIPDEDPRKENIDKCILSALSSIESGLKSITVGGNDHDLLIELKTGQQWLRDDIREIKDGTTKRITDLETLKADKKDLDSLAEEVHIPREKRVRSLENKLSALWIMMAVYSAIGITMIVLILGHMWKVQVV